MTTVTTVDRSRLAARQARVLTDLLAGRTPEGFDAAQCAMTSQILLNKRATVASYACVELMLLPGWRRTFASYAAQTPEHGCGHEDVAGFAKWLRTHHTDRISRSWLRLTELYGGQRHTCIAVHEGHWSFIVGIGSTVWHLHLKSVPHTKREETT